MVQIIIDTKDPLSATDRRVLAVLLEENWPPAPEPKTHTPSPEGDDTKPVPAKKAALAKKAASRAPEKKPEAPAPEEAAEPSEGVLDIETVKSAVKRLTAAGYREDVVEALAEVEVKRVTGMTSEQMAAFMGLEKIQELLAKIDG